MSRPMEAIFRERPFPEDRDRVGRVLTSSGYFRPDEIAVGLELVDEYLAKGTASGYHFLIADFPDDPCAGYTCYGPTPCTLWSFDLYWIAVREDRRGSGLGRRLMTVAEERIAAMGGRRIYIETSGTAFYRPTHGFYHRTGYHLEARVAEFYGPGDDKLIFVKVVDPTDPPAP